jgi:inorganic pyrophosphatase
MTPGLTLLALLAAAGAQWIHPFDLPQDGVAPGEAWMVVEIPHGSATKFEIDKRTGHVVADRMMSMPVVYPANYGLIPRTHAGDGDNLDALLFTREPLPPGTVVKVRVVGVLPMLDGGEQDDKLIAVPASSVDPSYDGILDIEDVPAMERERIRAFFRVYKQLPEGRKSIELQPLRDRAAALKALDEAMEAYASSRAEAAAG